MNLPLFFSAALSGPELTLDEDTSKHVIQVLRKKAGDRIALTDGLGQRVTGEITGDHRKHCTIRVEERETVTPPARRVGIALSLVKNASRYEWFLEKATEIGIQEIFPLLCERTEKEKFRQDRLQGIVTSAMLQSQQSWMPVLHAPVAFADLVRSSTYARKLIAHCLPEGKQELGSLAIPEESVLLLVGPEGDFTADEIRQALEAGFEAVGLGATRLRTETAGMVGAVLLRR